MFRKLGFVSVVVVLVLSSCNLSRAQSPDRGQGVDEHDRITLKGNTRPEARAENDRGRVANNFPLEHMLLQLKRTPAQEQALEQFVEELHTNDSPNFHKWITAREFARRFGVSRQDRQTVIRWLQSHGLSVNVDYPSGMLIDFSGTAEQVQSAFSTEIHQFDIKGTRHYANLQDPQIPTALAAVVAGVVSLNDFHPRPLNRLRTPQFTFPDGFGDNTNAVVPADLATIYNINPVFNSGITGKGQTIVVIEDTNVFTMADWNSFRTTLGLGGYSSASFTSVHPAPASGANNCSDPGIVAPNDAEAILDAEWASAAAPDAAILMASCADTVTTFGGLIAIENLINSSNPPAIISISYGQCETVNGAAANAAYNSVYQQAVAEGASIFVAAGDSGAAGCDNSVSEATHGIAANAFASTPYNVAVGGTDFSDTYSSTNPVYWNDVNSTTFGSAKSYIPEIPWNDSCAGGVLAAYEGLPAYGSESVCSDPFLGLLLQTTVAGGGAPSGCATGTPSTTDVVSGSCQGWAKPIWQSVLGNPADGVRDTPDISLFAADGLWGHYYVFCWSDAANGGAACTGDPSAWSGAGGTSFSAPIMAGVQALINQKLGAPQGNPNPVYYQLANLEYGGNGSSACNSSNGTNVGGNCVFYDVTFGDIVVDCAGTANCFFGDGSVGVLSTSNSAFSPAYGTNTGWDFSTGIGTVNVANLVNSWPGAGPTFFLSASPANLSLAPGTNASTTISIAPQNGFSGTVDLSASGLPSGVTAVFLPTSTTTTSTLTFTAGSTAAAGTVNVTIMGTSGNVVTTTTIALTVTPVPTFGLSALPAAFTVRQGGTATSTVTVAPQNGFNGSVSLSASGLPSGVTAVFNPATTTSSSTLTFTVDGTAAPGTASISVNGVSGSLATSTPISLTIKAVTLPSGWTNTDIGAVGTAGDASYGSGTFTIKASGQQIYGSADAMHWAYQPLSGDGTIVARLLGVQGGSGSATAGVMIRETLDANARNAKTSDWLSYNGIYFDLRSTPGGSTSEPGNIAVPALPYWMKLVRSGNTFTSYAALDGVNWVQLGSAQTIVMANNVYIGLAVNSGSSSALATATFDNVSLTSSTASTPSISAVSATTGSIGSSLTITGTNFGASQASSTVLLNGTAVTINSWSNTSLSATIAAGATSGPLAVTAAPAMNVSNPVTFTVTPQPLPAGWLDRDVGSLGIAGNASYSNASFTVKTAGLQIYNGVDAMHFVYQPLTGDGTIVARLVSMQGGSSYATAGVMIRETLDANARNAKTSDWPAFNGIYFDLRSTPGGATSEPGSQSAALPYWVKLVRSGNTFTSYASSDGSHWTQLGSSQTISMAPNVYVGLAVNSGSSSAQATATFDNVTLTTP